MFANFYTCYSSDSFGGHFWSLDRLILYFWNRYRYFQILFTDVWPVADIRLATDTDILKLAYQYIFRYLNCFG